MGSPRERGCCTAAISTKVKETEFMSDGQVAGKRGEAKTRRDVLMGGAAVTLAALAGAASMARGEQAMQEKQSTGAEAKITALHQEIDLKAAPHRIYEILLDSKQFAAFTGRAAEISAVDGGAFKMFGGLIEGRNIELVPDTRIVQAWRPANWDPGVYSIVEFQLKSQAGGAKLILDHKGFPEGDFAHLDPGWHMQYWEPLAKYLAS
jgi:activator of HSP90 ATPase